MLLLTRLVAVGAATLLALPTVTPAQQAGGGSAPAAISTPPREAAQFGFLVGQWSVIVFPKVSSLAARIHGQPKLQGTWKAWRALDGFGIEDELRIMDGSGNPTNLTHTVRVFDGTTRKWTQSMLDVYRTRTTLATGEWKDNMMRLRGEGRDGEGKAYISESRFYDITPTGFKYESNRSTDGGRTWETGVLKLEARRVAVVAPR